MPVPAEYEGFWADARAAGAVLDDAQFYEAFAFGDSPALAHELAQLVLSGRKRATADLVWSCEADGRRPPRPGDLSIVTDGDRRPLAIIETTQVDVLPYEAVTEDFARREGEGEATLASWRRDHAAYFARECARIGRTPTPDMPVVCERFRRVHPAGAAAALHLRALVAADVPRYRAMMLHAYASVPDAFTTTAEERAGAPDSWWLKRIADPAGMSLALGAFDGDELAGTVTIEFASKPKTRHKALLIGMFVNEACRGQGAGERLVQAALALAAARPGVRMITLTVTEGNAPALQLYQRCGFEVFGIEPMAIATPEGDKAKVHMWRRLTPSSSSPAAAAPAR